MSTKIKCTNEPLGEVNIIADFLPTPAELAFNEEGVKITLSLSKKALNFSNPRLLKIIHNISV